MLTEYLSAEINRLALLGKLPLHRQLYEALRSAVLGGKLTSGHRLPSSRDLAQDLHLSRNTVIAALNQLVIEGYLASHVGQGTFVTDRAPAKHTRRKPVLADQGAKLSSRGEALLTHFCAAQLEIYPFTPGIVDFTAFPMALWQRLQHKHWRMAYPDMLDYSYSGGYAPLRKAVSDYLRVFRNMPVDTEQVIITTGTQQSLELCSQLLADFNDTVWLEDPAYWGAVKAFMATGLRLHPVAVDQQGIAPQEADEATPPRLIYVTPSHQYPTGTVMSLRRRHAILAAARHHKAWILEDDYDSEFRFSGPPIASLAGLDSDERVLYMGSFSKVLYPGLKLGYLVVPKRLAAPLKQAHYDLNRPGQIPLQAALAEFIEMGHFATALRNARQTYAERRRCLLESLRPCLGSSAQISGAEQGLHLCVNLPDTLDDKALAQRIGAMGLTVRPLSAYCIRRTDIRGIVIGYGYAPFADIEQHGPTLAKAMTAALARYGG
ncbi:PLP-dependent aminotransferase family protein [Rhodoferax sp.]|uniref:MocR-like pyridoxine biosynthesis transcription factor PdxR n=1 Tax=Rhodoferax sp. TaxID=50421 RepID=UPI0026314F90|nr:PLP-dependent aminotransferase family protein [Rhodoferax sp.]MDD2924073.1 PLP-dependent aminotransferase family protein [Rhodoferax sp.]